HFDIYPRTVRGFTNKEATKEQARKLEKLVACRKAGEAPSGELARWLENCPAKFREQLGAWGILSPARVAAGKTLSDHVEEWVSDLKAKGTSADRARDSAFRVMKTFKSCGFRNWSDIDILKVEKHLADWVNRSVLSQQTRNHYIQHLRQFCAWMVDNDRASVSPLRMLKKKAVTKKCRESRALTSLEFAHFINTARIDSGVVEKLDGASRAVLYVVARRTGLRWSELRSLKRSRFDLHDEKPVIHIGKADEKHPRGLPIPLSKDAAKLLREYFAAHPAPSEAPAFMLSPRNVGAEMVRYDLARAGIPYRDEQGLIYDFHALRGQLATDLARGGIAPQKAQKAMRHSTMDLTLRHYTHLTIDDLREAVDSLDASDDEVAKSEGSH
ncbi:MAG: site-specific integrase, partial [Planctomycetes bacterium]|nr:site-specific integrase [Planctomycetota bacterium]